MVKNIPFLTQMSLAQILEWNCWLIVVLLFTLQKYRPSSGPEVTPYITVVVLITGVIGGLILVISVILFCKYCIKKRDKVFTRSVHPFCRHLSHFFMFILYLSMWSVVLYIIYMCHIWLIYKIQTEWICIDFEDWAINDITKDKS